MTGILIGVETPNRRERGVMVTLFLPPSISLAVMGRGSSVVQKWSTTIHF